MEFIIECECGTIWNMDAEPTPEECVGSVWRIGTAEDEEPSREDIDWGIWVDQDGREVDHS